TCSATPAGTRPGPCGPRSTPAATGSGSTSTTTGRAFPPPSESSCCGGSAGWTRPARSTPAVPASGWPLPRQWPRPTAATSWSATPTSAAPASRSGCRHLLAVDPHHPPALGRRADLGEPGLLEDLHRADVDLAPGDLEPGLGDHGVAL